MYNNNEFDRLLEYLESQNLERISKKTETNKSKNIEVKKPQIERKIELVSEKTEKSIEESRVNNIIYPETPQSISSTSKCFDILRFESLLRSKLIDEYKKLQSYERPYISVGELFNCLRSNYYSRLRYQVDIKEQFKFAYLKILQEVGNSVHSVVQSTYDFSETEKTVVSEKYKVKGRLDALKENFLYEIKTLEEKKLEENYKLTHYYQGLIYSYILNTEYNYNIDTVVLIYFYSDNLKKRPHVVDVPINNELAIMFLEKAILLQSCINKKEVPDVIGASVDQCKFCLYKNYCIKDDSKTEKPFEKKKKYEEKQDKSKKTVFLL